jgi:HAE1 family hydrophobic/amphiphilic exporter-1
MVNVTVDYPGWRINDQVGYYSAEQSIKWCSRMKYMTSDAGNDGEASIQLVFNLGTDPNQAINVQNRVASVTNKLPLW